MEGWKEGWMEGRQILRIEAGGMRHCPEQAMEMPGHMADVYRWIRGGGLAPTMWLGDVYGWLWGGIYGWV
jgi:hypothetical protein